MAIGPDATQKQLNATDRFDLLLVVVTFKLQVASVAVEDIDVVRLHVNMREEVLVHEAVVALRVVPWDPNILVLICVSLFSSLPCCCATP